MTMNGQPKPLAVFLQTANSALERSNRNPNAKEVTTDGRTVLTTAHAVPNSADNDTRHNKCIPAKDSLFT